MPTGEFDVDAVVEKCRMQSVGMIDDPDNMFRSVIKLAEKPTAIAYAEAHALYERGGRALTDRQPPLEQAHIHAQLASDYMKSSDKEGGGGTHLGHRHELAAKSHNSASKAWQRMYDNKGSEESAVQASQRAAESGRKASEEAGSSDAIDAPEPADLAPEVALAFA